MPSRSALNQVCCSRPGTASSFTPKDGIAQSWITSFDLTPTMTFLFDRHDHLMVDGEETRLTRLEVGVLHDDRIELDALVGIFIGPVPLIAGRGDGEVGLGEIVLGEEQPERGDGDGDEDQNRHHGPGDLERGVVGGAGRLGIALLVEANHHIDQ